MKYSDLEIPNASQEQINQLNFLTSYLYNTNPYVYRKITREMDFQTKELQKYSSYENITLFILKNEYNFFSVDKFLSGIMREKDPKIKKWKIKDFMKRFYAEYYFGFFIEYEILYKINPDAKSCDIYKLFSSLRNTTTFTSMDYINSLETIE